MKYERLKENIETLCTHNERHIPVFHITDGKKHEIDLIREIVADCREILNKIEQGTLIELPCKVGDTVYCVYAASGIQEWEVGGIQISENTILFLLGHKGTDDYNAAHLSEKGKYLFFTREEAEKRLKELQNG